MSTKSIKTTFSSTSPLFQGVQISNVQGDKTMKRSFNILIGGISLAWIMCMMILISDTLQG